MNTAGGLNGLISIIEQSGTLSEIKYLSGTAAKLSEELIDEIFAQKQLLSAESGTLRLLMRILMHQAYLKASEAALSTISQLKTRSSK